MPEAAQNQDPRIVVYRSPHPVEARRACGLLLAHGLAAEVLSPEIRKRGAEGGGEFQTSPGFAIVVAPADAGNARSLLDTARAAGDAFTADRLDVEGFV